MTATEHQVIVREFEHVQRRRAATHPKAARRVQLMAGHWPDWIFGREPTPETIALRLTDHIVAGE